MGTAFLYGNGGGIDNLKFRVYSATSLPSSGKENDVCIITSTPIFYWEAGAIDNPTWSMDDGFVYLTCDASDASQPNLLRKNALYLKLMRCWQYEKGTWSTKDAYQYRNGAWVQFSTVFKAIINVTYPAGSTCTATDGVTTLTAPDTSGTWDCIVPNAGDWTVSLDSGFSEVVNGIIDGGSYTVDKWYLYNLGDERTAITGGWAPMTGLSNYWNGGYKVVKHANDFECYGNGGNTISYLVTSVPIDLTKINEICINVLLARASGSTYHHRRINIANGKNYTQMHLNSVASIEFSTGTTGMVRLDVSKITGKYFIGVGAEYESGSTGSLKVSGVWLR